MEGQAEAMINVETVEVKLPDGAWWTKYGQLEKQDLSKAMKIDGESHFAVCLPDPFVSVPHPYKVLSKGSS